MHLSRGVGALPLWYNNAANRAGSTLHLEATGELLRQELNDMQPHAFRRSDIKAGRQSVTIIGDLQNYCIRVIASHLDVDSSMRTTVETVLKRIAHEFR